METAVCTTSDVVTRTCMFGYWVCVSCLCPGTCSASLYSELERTKSLLYHHSTVLSEVGPQVTVDSSSSIPSRNSTVRSSRRRPLTDVTPNVLLTDIWKEWLGSPPPTMTETSGGAMQAERRAKTMRQSASWARHARHLISTACACRCLRFASCPSECTAANRLRLRLGPRPARQPQLPDLMLRWRRRRAATHRAVSVRHLACHHRQST